MVKLIQTILILALGTNVLKIMYSFMYQTRDVVRNIALTDNIAFLGFAVAGIQEGC
jgi:hypothetical protein